MQRKMFCDPNDVRAWLRTPFQVNDFTVECNGHVLFATTRHGDYDDLKNIVSANQVAVIEKMLAEIDSNTFAPLLSFELPQQEECRTCQGTKKCTVETCPECDGDGDVEAETDYNTYDGLECKSCSGDGQWVQIGGETDCVKCSGTGRVFPRWSHVEIAGVHVNPEYLSRIAIYDVEIAGVPSRNRLYFRSAQCKGIIMAMKMCNDYRDKTAEKRNSATPC